MEQWRDIPGWADHQISNFGRVRSLNFNHTGEVGILRTSVRGGYASVVRNYPIHLLVASVFHPNPDNKPEVDHIDRDKLNNLSDNLRWVTKSENNINRSFKLPTSGERHVHKCKGGFQVHIKRNNQHVYGKWFKTLEEAKLGRDEFLRDLEKNMNP